MEKSGKIFERVDDLVYERDIGSSQRILTDASRLQQSEHLKKIKEDKLWGEIRREAITNKTLQEALNHAIMIYTLSKDYKDV